MQLVSFEIQYEAYVSQARVISVIIMNIINRFQLKKYTLHSAAEFFRKRIPQLKLNVKEKYRLFGEYLCRQLYFQMKISLFYRNFFFRIKRIILQKKQISHTFSTCIFWYFSPQYSIVLFLISIFLSNPARQVIFQINRF